jgi:hypothetical protein
MKNVYFYVYLIIFLFIPILAYGAPDFKSSVGKIYLCMNEDGTKFISRSINENCILYTTPKGWITFRMSENFLVDILPSKIVKEKDGFKLWTHYYFTEPAIFDNRDIRYDGVKSISKYYCKKKQTRMIQATYTLGSQVVYERLEPEAILEEIEPGTMNEEISSHLCR